MTDLLIDFALVGALSPVIIAITQAIKPIPQVPRVAYPFIAMLLGVIGYIALSSQELTVEILGGIVAGLAASGLYSGGKTMKETIKSEV